MDTAQNSQHSQTDRRLTLLEQEISAILSAANLSSNDKLRDQLLNSLNALYGPQGTTGQFATEQLTQAAGASLIGAEIAVFQGSATAPGLTMLSDTPRGEYRTWGYFADSPLGPYVASFGYLKTASTNKDAPEGTSLGTWFFQEWIDLSKGGNNRPMRYLRSNVNNNGWTRWAAQEAIDTTNMFNYTGPDLPLAVGQSFSYDTGTTAVGSLPLCIQTQQGQLYEITVVQRNPSSTLSPDSPYKQINLDMYLLANNTFYPGAFSESSIRTTSNFIGVTWNTPAYLNTNYANWGVGTDNVTYSVPPVIAGQNTGGPTLPPPYANYALIETYSASGFPGVTNASLSGFWFDDIAGASNPPWIRKIQVYTGDASTVPMAMHVGGGGSYAYNSGVNTVAAVWQNYFQVSYYNSLGTLLNSYNSAQGSSISANTTQNPNTLCSFLANVKRLA